MSEFPNNDPNNPFEASKMQLPPGGGTHVDKSKLAAPAMAILIVSILGLLYSIASPFIAPMLMEAMNNAMIDVLPDEDAREEFRRQMEEQQASPMNGILTWGGTIFGLIIGGLCIFGALQMKNASSYGWSMAACIISIIGMNFCCCLSTPVGIWGLIVLLKPDVKAAFNTPG